MLLAAALEHAFGGADGGANLGQIHGPIEIHRQHLLEAIDDCGVLSPARSGGGRRLINQAGQHCMDELVLEGTGDFRMGKRVGRRNGKLSRGRM
jgi:hypothetical protein